MNAINVSQYFEHVVEYQIAVCRECRHGVLPSHIESHVRRLHKVEHAEAKRIAEAVHGWAGVAEYASEVQVPSQVVEPIPELPMFADGKLCQLDPDGCHKVFRSVKAIKEHWRQVHEWSTAGKRGRPGRVSKKRMQERRDKGFGAVLCQRLFVQGQGSQYFQVQPAGSHAANMQPVPGSQAAWAQVGKQMARVWESMEKRAQDTIQEGEKDEVNPWLERTQWMPYLVGMERPALLACMERPVASPDPGQESEAEPVEAAIWAAMDGIARFSQSSVVEQVGVFVRLEAIRTEKHQTRFQPLQPYMDKDAIVKHTRPWQQMLMFFARTQREHTWKSPQYRFTRRQQEAWEALVEAAERDSRSEETDQEEEEDEDMVDAVEEAVEADEQEEEEEEQAQQTERKTLTRVQKACLTFCIALLNQSITRKEYDSPLVCALAVLGVKGDGWKGPEQYPPILSAVIKIARFMVVQQALELSGPERKEEEEAFEDDSAYESDGSRAHTRRPKGCLHFVQEMMDRFMVRGSHGPMQWMLDLRTYGLKIHYNTTSQGHVEWTGKDELLYKGLQFTMAQFRSMVHGLATESRRLLQEELLFGNQVAEPVPSVPWESIRDNPTDERPGWNFLQDQRTQMPVDGKRWLFERIGKEARIRNRFMKPGTRSGVDREAVEQYVDRVIAFREKLAVLMHICGGQPGRGPELLSVRHSNTVQGGHRNIFIEDGMVVYATRYHKGYNVSGDVKIIHRYLPRQVGELVVWYMWLVLPFQQRLEALVWEKDAVSSHMWPADPSGRKWTSDRLREALKQESRIGLGQDWTMAGYRQMAIGISRRFLRKSTAFQHDESEEGKEGEEVDEEKMAARIADWQAGHTTHIAGMVYARGIMELSGAVADRRQQYRASSTDWHRFLGFEDGAEEKSSRKRKKAPFEREAAEARIQRRARLRKMDTAAQLKRMMGEAAEFRGEQQQAIQAIVAGESPVVAVMPTGAGKSMLFMLPAWAEQGGTSIVVVPLIALRGDMMRRCKRLGITCAAWESRHPADGAAVVLVTPESAVSEGFATFLNRLRATQQLDRIVIDECHVVLNRRYTFRKQMQQLGKLAAAQTQMVLLTATLPPSEEDALYRRMHFEREQVKMFRAATTRSNIAYRVVRVGKAVKAKEVEEMVVKLVQQKRRKYRTGKIVVYSSSVARVKELAQKIGCQAYYHDAVGKAGVLEAFAGGTQRVMVATSALGMGIDIADIRCIVHVDWPLSVMDYAQESGRGGRDGEGSEAIVIAQEGRQWRAKDKQGEAEQALVRKYVEGEQEGEGWRARCRRVVLDAYLDGKRTREGCEEGEEKCDVCWGGEGYMESGGEEAGEEADETEEADEARRIFTQQEQERQGPQQKLIRQRQQEFGEMEWLRRQLAWWANRCGICEAAGNGESGHDIRRCWRAESRNAQESIEAAEKEIKFEKWAGCWWCGVPQEICNRWEENSFGRYQMVRGGDCQYRGVLMGGLWGIVLGYAEVGTQWAERLAGLGVGNREGEMQLIEFMGKKQVLETVESNQLVGEFCWVTRLIAG
jgi:superfamily II DNA helicase RecQ